MNLETRQAGPGLLTALEAPSCGYCGEPVMLELREVWGHDFMLDTCCEALLEEATAMMQDSPKDAAAWIAQRSGLPLRRVIQDELGGLLLDYQLALAPCTLRQAQDFIGQHHRHCRPPRGWPSPTSPG